MLYVITIQMFEICSISTTVYKLNNCKNVLLSLNKNMLLPSNFYFQQIQIVLQILFFLGTIYKNCNINSIKEITFSP